MTKDRLSLDDLVRLFKLPSEEEVDEANADNVWAAGIAAGQAALDEEAAEEEAEAARYQAEVAEQRAVYRKWHTGVVSAAEALFGKHHLRLEPVPVKGEAPEYPHVYRLRPEKTWREAADAIRRTMNGVGLFYAPTLRDFLEQICEAPKGAVLSHYHWIPSYSRVYGAPSARGIYENAW